jgi:hypothetical protein
MTNTTGDTEEILRIAEVNAAGTSLDAPQKLRYNLGVPLRYHYIAAVLCQEQPSGDASEA